ncbi:helix-turn-helix domain-containing protein [Agromyces humi]|uniref:helix-turn-helix domain-containing protein n=1 Tax=Agromyces humi TaxID=1766800 RepID=UPI001357F37A|nr:helix-turn-helix transcriptional regulator [Agromyces humi]
MPFTLRQQSGNLIREARAAGGISLEQAAAVAQSTVSAMEEIEAGVLEPTFEQVERILWYAGYRLVPAPVLRGDSLFWAVAVRASLDAGDEEGAFRAWLSFSDGLAKERGANRVALALFPAPETGSDLWDAAFAAVVEYWLVKDGLPIPDWVGGISRFLQAPTQLRPARYSPKVAKKDVPTPFLRRNVYIHEAMLQSV